MLGPGVFLIDRLADHEAVVQRAAVFEIVAAFTQAYRENARYLHRIYKWVAKVGLDWCKETIVDDLANRRALYDRFMVSQSVYQKDPWAEHAKPAERPAWGPMADFTLEAAE